ncbi:MAG: DUF1294 domain-containing protein [Candidatus Komeilibacteria bacterium]|nr:DUF1294 domain-containing protein [Candidatus Komeilibacteria bacterium]
MENNLYGFLHSSVVYVVFLYLIINLSAFLSMWRDKHRAIDQNRRIPEVKLLFWAMAFGALGVGLGMICFRHKIRTWYFYLGVPLALVNNIIVLKFLGFIF